MAGLWLRFAGNLLDSLIYLVAFMVPAIALGAFPGTDPGPTPAERWDDRTWEDHRTREAVASDEDRLEAIALIGPLLVFVVQCVLLMRRGQSIGKCAVKTRIVDYRTGGHPGFLRIVVMRSVLPGIIAQFCGFFGLIDALFIFGDDRRCLHDRMATTSVVTANTVPDMDAARVFD